MFSDNVSFWALYTITRQDLAVKPYEVEIFFKYQDVSIYTCLSLAYFTQANADVLTIILVHETHIYLIWFV